MPGGGRVKARSIREPSPVTVSGQEFEYDLPYIAEDDSFRVVVRKLSLFFADALELPSTFDQLRTTAAGECLRVLVQHLNDNCTHPAIVHALLALKWYYATENEHRGLSEARANACEIVAWRFLTRLSEREAVDCCLYELPGVRPADGDDGPPSPSPSPDDDNPEHADERRDETTALLPQHSRPSRNPPGRFGNRNINDTNSGALGPFGSLPRGAANAKRSELLSSLSRLTVASAATDDDNDDGGGDRVPHGDARDPTLPFASLNALEIAAIADAKRFLGQHVVQKIITGIWNGDIVFWQSLSVLATKKPHFYNPHSADPFSRLRVPKYLKCWEVVFFAAFLALYYGVLVEQSTYRITPTELGLYVWLAAFLYDELSEWVDAGSIFYTTDIWNIFDVCIILLGVAFAVLRLAGISRRDPRLVDVAFDVLALEALFMIPRVCSLLSLSPYWGTLIPCLKEMGKDFVKFMVLIVIIYVGFLTTFCLIGRDHFSSRAMTWNMTKIFYGSNYIGFEIMERIDQVFGPPLMILFLTLSSILLTGSMAGMLSNSFSRVFKSAREEFLYGYSVYVLGASTSNRLTHFYPPFNLVALLLFRPLRYLCYSRRRPGAEDHHFRAARIVLLKATHLPIVGVIQLYELVRQSGYRDEFAGFKGPKITAEPPPPGGRARRAAAAAMHGRGRPSVTAAATAAAAQEWPPSTPQARPGMHRPRGPDRQSRGAAEDDWMEEQTAETRIEELHRKIDELTTLVMDMRSQQQGGRETD